MSTPRLMLETLDAAGLNGTLQSHRDALRYVYLESETRVVLAPFSEYLATPSPWPRVRWLHGRAFGTDLEIRWRQEDLIIELQALSEADNTPSGWAGSEWNNQFDPEPARRDVLLAERNSAINYPISDSPRLMLRCLDYRINGIVVLTRLVDLLPYNE